MAQFLKRMIDRFRRALLWLWSQEGTPGQRARGLAAGVFAGCFPLFGFQTFLGVLFANLLRGNTFLAVVGTWISNPMTYLPLFWLNFQIGCILLGTELNFGSLGKLTPKELWYQGWLFGSCLFVGSAILGLMISLISGIIVYFLLKRTPR